MYQFYFIFKFNVSCTLRAHYPILAKYILEQKKIYFRETGYVPFVVDFTHWSPWFFHPILQELMFNSHADTNLFAVNNVGPIGRLSIIFLCFYTKYLSHAH